MAPPLDPDYAREKEARRKTRQEKRRNEALGARNDAHNHVLREDVDALRAAAAAGLDLEDVDDDGCSPAYFAVCRDSGAMLDALAACGVDPVEFADLRLALTVGVREGEAAGGGDAEEPVLLHVKFEFRR